MRSETLGVHIVANAGAASVVRHAITATGEMRLHVHDDDQPLNACQEFGRTICLIVDLALCRRSVDQLLDCLTEFGFHSPPLVIVSPEPTLAEAVDAFRTGVFDYVPLSTPGDRIQERLERALVHGLHLSHENREIAKILSRMASLSRAEHDVVGHLVDGATNKQIAYNLGIAIRTVENRRRLIRRKMEVGNVAELVRDVLRVRSARPPVR